MSATTPRVVPESLARAHGVRFGGVLRSEWIKLRSLRSTFWCSLIIVVLGVGLAALLGVALQAQGTPSAVQRQTFALQAITASTQFTSLVAAVLGALMITGEFGTGQIRSTFAAVPARLPALLGKGIVVALATFVVAAVTELLSLLVAAPLLTAQGLEVDLGDPKLWLGILGGAIYIALIALFALAIGSIIRNSAGGIAVSIAVILVLPIVGQIAVSLTRAQWVSDAMQFLPTQAGQRMFAYPVDLPSGAVQDGVTLDAGQGGLVMLAWVVVLLAIGGILIRRRDV